MRARGCAGGALGLKNCSKDYPLLQLLQDWAVAIRVLRHVPQAKDVPRCSARKVQFVATGG
jgi:hypothetical protein